ncbi:hypothetical protein ACMSSJ_11265 [Kerstersia gyiorum]|uniref:hypothetical protein n=1 Tax=Kerstersia gyiorum TaxID=206506 RepID=UPI0039EA306C
MKVIYTTQMTGFKEGFAYRNPRYFSAIEPDAEHVIVVGNWPDVVAAYEKAGIPVEIEGVAQAGNRPGNADAGEQESGIDPTIQPADAQPLPVADGLDDLDADQLHAMAKERGIKVRANASADKVREALREVVQ